MERRDLLKFSAFVASASVAGSGFAQVPTAPRPSVGIKDIKPTPEDTFVPNRFKGKTILITGCARGMGAALSVRAAREGANVVGVDWIEDLGKQTIRVLLTPVVRLFFCTVT